MNIYSAIVKSLDTPDDQGDDWYGWAANQMAHAMLGVILYQCTHTLWAVGAVAFVKELTDFIRVPTKATAKDSVQDIGFYLVGAFFVVPSFDVILAIWLGTVALLLGVVPRARRMYKAVKAEVNNAG